MEIVTGYAGKAHITAEDWAELNRHASHSGSSDHSRDRTLHRPSLLASAYRSSAAPQRDTYKAARMWSETLSTVLCCQ